jgi:hypothetical protein
VFDGTTGKLLKERAVQTVALDDVSGSFNDSTTVFALTVSSAAFTPYSARNVFVNYNGLMQIPGSGYTVSGSNITFTFTPQAGDSCTMWAINV